MLGLRPPLPPRQWLETDTAVCSQYRARRENLGEVNKLHRGHLAHTHRRKRVVQSKHGPGEGCCGAFICWLSRYSATKGQLVVTSRLIAVWCTHHRYWCSRRFRKGMEKPVTLVLPDAWLYFLNAELQFWELYFTCVGQTNFYLHA